MAFEITLSPEALADLRRLRAYQRAEVRDALDQFLRHEPTRESKSRIKRLVGVSHPQYRLRVGELRIFYDIEGEGVRVLAILAKPDAAAWLEEQGRRDENGASL